jgi:methylated-DNA-[protein]-cysteine S-methyltransferase
VLDELAQCISRRILRHPGRLDEIARQLDEHFDGRRQTFELPLDWRLSSGFRRTVLHLLPTITYGFTASYTDVATTLTGRSGAARAVGTACATNPMPIAVPCHRVIRARRLGGYLGGVDTKATLLALERAVA